MSNMTVRNLPEEVYLHLRERAKRNKRSVEAEVRAILVNSYVVSHSGGLAQRLRERFGEYLGNDLAVERDRTPGEAARFE